MKLNSKETKILSAVIAIWGIVFISSGIVMNNSKKTETVIKYKLDVSTQKISEAQAKKKEIILKELETEINTPISVNIKDYLVDADKMDESIIKKLELDTSLVNINQAGTYKYIVKYNKKKYQGTIKVKEKELPDMTFTLKNITLDIGDAIPADKREYINETISDEVYQNITLDISQVKNSIQNDYKYYIIYKNTRYEGTISVRNKIIPPSDIKQEEEKSNEQKDTSINN